MGLLTFEDNVLNENASGILELALDSHNLGAWVYDTKLRKIIEHSGFVNFYKELLDNPKKEFGIDMFNDTDKKLLENECELVAIGKKDKFSIEVSIDLPDEDRIYLNIIGKPAQRDENGYAKTLYGITKNITYEKQTSSWFFERNQNMELIHDEIGIHFWESNLFTKSIKYAKKNEEIPDGARVKGRLNFFEWGSLVHPDDLPIVLKTLKEFSEGKNETFSVDMRVSVGDGKFLYTKNVGKTIEYDISGKPLRMIGATIDTSELKEKERLLKNALDELSRNNEDLQEEMFESARVIKRIRKTSTALFDSNPEVNLIFSNDFQLLDCNPQAVVFFGANSKEDLLENFINYAAKALPEHQPNGAESIGFLEWLRKAREQGHIEFESYLLINGKLTPVSYIFKKIKYGDSYGIAVYQHDLSELRETQNQLNQQKKVFTAINNITTLMTAKDDSNFNAVISDSLSMLGKSLNLDRVYVWKNKTINNKAYCTQIFEWAEGVESVQDTDLAVDIPYDEVAPNWREKLVKGQYINQFVCDMAGEEREHLEQQNVQSVLVAPIIYDNFFWGFIGFDDCKEKRVFSAIEERILQSIGLVIAGILSRVDIMNRLYVAREEAQSSIRAKDTFLASVSHEIRTPLNAITGMTAIASNSNDLTRVKDCVKNITTATKRLLRMVDEILDLSKIENENLYMEYKEFSFTDTVNNVIKEELDEAKEFGVRLSVHIGDGLPKEAIGDSARLSMVLTSLISMGIKTAPKKSTVNTRIRLIETKSEKAKIEIVVDNSASGFSNEEIDRLFLPFELAQDPIHQSKGVGMGFSTTKGIVELMNGSMSVTALGKTGNRIKANFYIEVDKKIDVLKFDVFDEVDDFSKYNALVVEDIDINREVVICILEETQITIDEAENGKKALEMIEKNPEKYDVIIMDIQMPVMDGLAATRAIRKLENRKDKMIPIIALTSSSFKEDVRNCLIAGMNDHVPKPVDYDELIEKVRKYLK